MGEPIENKVTRSLNAAEGLYHRLVLIVGKCGTGKTHIIQNLAKLHKVEPINVNMSLSKELIELTEKQRPLKVSEILAQTVKNLGEKVFLDNTEILFDVELEQNPLVLLQGLSRNLTVVASWNGTVDKDKLLYAEPSHREYRSYDFKDTLVVSLSGDATIDYKNNQARIN
jgi:Cdc6-like AAA superfamily ATPase